MPDILTPTATATSIVAPDDIDLDDEYTLDVRVVIVTHGKLADCATDDQCGNTCKDGASACNSSFDDPA